MKLNFNCVRDIMLYLDENLNDELFSDDLTLDYPIEVINYTLSKLIEANYIVAKYNVLGSYKIEDITFDGYKFISKVKDDTFWNKVLSKISKTTGKLTMVLLEKIIFEIPNVS